MVEVYCYGVPKKFRTRRDAISFYRECIDNSEGAERERYTHILLKLIATKKNPVYDYEEEY